MGYNAELWDTYLAGRTDPHFSTLCRALLRGNGMLLSLARGVGLYGFFFHILLPSSCGRARALKRDKKGEDKIDNKERHLLSSVLFL